MLDSQEVRNLSLIWLEMARDSSFNLETRRFAKKQARQLSKLYVLI